MGDFFINNILLAIEEAHWNQPNFLDGWYPTHGIHGSKPKQKLHQKQGWKLSSLQNRNIVIWMMARIITLALIKTVFFFMYAAIKHHQAIHSIQLSSNKTGSAFHVVHSCLESVKSSLFRNVWDIFESGLSSQELKTRHRFMNNPVV